MDSLRNLVIAEHFKLIRQLEARYEQYIANLLKQKAAIHEKLQKHFYQQLSEINNITTPSIKEVIDITPSKDSECSPSPFILPNLKKEFDENENNDLCLSNPTIINIKPSKNISHIQYQQTLPMLESDEVINNDNKNSKTTSNCIIIPRWKCNICNKQCRTKTNYSLHIKSHSKEELQGFADQYKDIYNEIELTETECDYKMNDNVYEENNKSINNGGGDGGNKKMQWISQEYKERLNTTNNAITAPPKKKQKISNGVDTANTTNTTNTDNKNNNKSRKISKALSDACQRYILHTQNITDYHPLEYIDEHNKESLCNNKERDSWIQRAELLKIEGNKLLKVKKYKEAIDKYTKAINVDPMNAIYFCNRAAAHTKLKNYGQAIIDSCKASEIDPNYVKAYIREGLAQYELGQYQKALNVYSKALNIIKPSKKTEKIVVDLQNKIDLCHQKLDDGLSTINSTTELQNINHYIGEGSKEYALGHYQIAKDLYLKALINMKPKTGKMYEEIQDKIGLCQFKIDKPLYSTESNRWSCFLCHIIFTTNTDLRRHLRLHHHNKMDELNPRNSKPERWNCHLCQQIFTNSTSLIRHNHLRTHNHVNVLNNSSRININFAGTDYQCQYCHFSSKNILNTRVHELLPHHKCSQCSKLFAEKHELNKHIESHRKYEYNPFKCKICNKRFQQKQYLTIHMRIHNRSSKQYSCHHCNKPFKHLSNLQKHIIKMHTPKESVLKTNGENIQSSQII